MLERAVEKEPNREVLAHGVFDAFAGHVIVFDGVLFCSHEFVHLEDILGFEFALSLTVCGERSQATISTNNLGEAFEELLCTVTDAVADDLPPDEALRILLAATNFER